MNIKKITLTFLTLLFCNHIFSDGSTSIGTQTEEAETPLTELRQAQTNETLKKTDPEFYANDPIVMLRQSNATKYRENAWFYFSKGGICAILGSLTITAANSLENKPLALLGYIIGLPSLYACLFYSTYLAIISKMEKHDAQSLKNDLAQQECHRLRLQPL